jgi:hypothetical protein
VINLPSRILSLPISRRHTSGGLTVSLESLKNIECIMPLLIFRSSAGNKSSSARSRLGKMCYNRRPSAALRSVLNRKVPTPDSSSHTQDNTIVRLSGIQMSHQSHRTVQCHPLCLNPCLGGCVGLYICPN